MYYTAIQVYLSTNCYNHVVGQSGFGLYMFGTCTLKLVYWGINLIGYPIHGDCGVSSSLDHDDIHSK